MTTDILLFGPAGLTLDPDAWAPGGVRGVDKVVQRVLYALFTPQGSVPGRPADGSTFLLLARDFHTELDLYTAWAAAEPAVTTTVRAAELAADADAEKFGAARMTAVSIVADVVTITLAVAALDGSQPTTPVTFELPT